MPAMSISSVGIYKTLISSTCFFEVETIVMFCFFADIEMTNRPKISHDPSVDFTTCSGEVRSGVHIDEKE